MIIKRLTEQSEIIGIKELQNHNLKTALDEVEKEKEGFVTAEYSIPVLEKMNAIEPSIIAKAGEEVVGYALVVTKAFYGFNHLIDDLFRQVDLLSYKSDKLCEVPYLMVGQLCVAKSHRGGQLSQKMYDFYRQELSKEYKYLITDVDDKNARSVKAHLQAGFEIIGTLDYGNSRWHIVLWG